MPLTLNESDGEIWFQPCRYDGSLEDCRDPFTGKPAKRPRNSPLTAAEEKAVKKLLSAAKAKAVKPNPKSVLEVSDESVKTGCMIKSHGRVSPDFFALVYAVLVAGNWCIVTDDAIVVASMDSVQGLPRPDKALPRDYPLLPSRVVLVESAEDLAKQVEL